MKIVVFVDKSRNRRRKAVESARPLLERYGKVDEVDLATAGETEYTGSADMAIVFGGDGSILRAARILGRRQIPTIGINMGKLGFLAEVAPDELQAALDIIKSGGFTVAERMMLYCRATRNGAVLKESLGLNDAVISRGAFSRLISTAVFIDAEHVTDYNGDGLIVATPVGSTAHSLAAGGAILEADLRAFTLTPICPHTLSNRPIVIPAERKIEVRVNPPDLPVMLTIDGQVNQDLKPGDKVQINEATERFKLIQTGARSYYATLRTKLGWGGHLNYAEVNNT